MEMIFADAFYFIALLSDSDESHARVMSMSDIRDTPMITTEYVLVEVANTLGQTRYRQKCASFMRYIRSQSQIEIVPADPQLFDAGLQLYENRPDKKWSLTDCISFMVMWDHRLTEALTHDRHFKQAGFRVLL
ncbi:MAG: PIN domain-containing protein [Phycisphaerales bacterium]|nr:PIN domain-containing protein [Phycisphaerales bacterium]